MTSGCRLPAAGCGLRGVNGRLPTVLIVFSVAYALAEDHLRAGRTVIPAVLDVLAGMLEIRDCLPWLGGRLPPCV